MNTGECLLDRRLVVAEHSPFAVVDASPRSPGLEAPPVGNRPSRLRGEQPARSSIHCSRSRYDDC